MIISKIVISEVAPSSKEVGWLLPLEDGTFKLRFFGPDGWVDAASGVQGPKGDKGDKGDTGPAGANGKSVTAIELTTNAEGAVIGGTATLSDKSTIQITVTQS
jgi:hypothetical protein